MSKRRDARYRSGRSLTWWKIKPALLAKCGPDALGDEHCMATIRITHRQPQITFCWEELVGRPRFFCGARPF